MHILAASISQTFTPACGSVFLERAATADLMKTVPSKPTPGQRREGRVAQWCQRIGVRLVRISLPNRPLSMIFVGLGALHVVVFSAAAASGEIHGWKDWLGPCLLWPLALRHCDLLRKRARPASQE